MNLHVILVGCSGGMLISLRCAAKVNTNCNNHCFLIARTRGDGFLDNILLCKHGELS